MDAPLALYRRYRPDTFAHVIGQEHVTEPLKAALRANRVNHAYLFSGPRGCGKTTSARILARALNCGQGPTEEPCGTCDSCVELATGGPGSVDVIEIDAASHGGVDDARDLREQATFQPMRDRYKIYIIDEAHMVSSQGFNALLKIVEEPPEHVRFIFATTEPEKVIGTVRSRTHHYPFRLIPPRVLSAYVAELCGREGIAIEPAAVPLVVRAGGGSARDTLSILDQLIGGAGEGGVTHRLAAGLLGFTPDALLDEVVDAFAARDGGGVFGVVDKVIETGQNPRRFTEDLLQRLRDLVIISAVPDASASGLIDVPEDQAERLVAQSARFGRHELSRAADLVAEGLMELKGTTAPRLLLELLCARVLLPAADDTARGVAARVDRLEKVLAMTTPQGAATGSPVAESGPGAAPPRQPTPQPAPFPEPGRSATGPVPESAPRAHPRDARYGGTAGPDDTWGGQPSTVSDERSTGAARQAPDPAAPAPAGAAPAPAEDAHVPAEAAPAPAEAAHAPAVRTSPSPEPQPGRLTLADIRRLWPEVVEAVKQRRRVTWIQLSQHAQVVALQDRTLTLGFNNPGARESFVNGRSDMILQQVLIDLVGQEWRIDAIVDPSAQPGAEPPHTVTRAASGSPQGPRAERATDRAPNPPHHAPSSPPRAPNPPTGDGASWSTPGVKGLDDGGRATADATGDATGLATHPVSRSARKAIQPTRTGGRPAGVASPSPADEDADRDDADADDVVDTAGLLSERLGAQVIEEIPHK